LILAATRQITPILDMVSCVFGYVCYMFLFIDMIVIIDLNGKDAFKTDWLGLDWMDLAWLGLASIGLAWLGMSWLGLA
jgi:hypothetical protein